MCGSARDSILIAIDNERKGRGKKRKNGKVFVEILIWKATRKLPTPVKKEPSEFKRLVAIMISAYGK